MTDPNRGVPVVSIYELGCASTTVAGIELSEPLSRPTQGKGFRIAGLWDGAGVDDVKNYLRDLDVAVKTLQNDLQTNVTRPAMLQSWNEWVFGWRKFLGDHSSTTQILLSGRDATMTQGKEYARQLEGWRDAYKRETSKLPEGGMPSTPQDQVLGVRLSTTAKVVLGVSFVALLGLGGYWIYRVVKNVKNVADENMDRAKRLGERALEARLGTSGGHHEPHHEELEE